MERFVVGTYRYREGLRPDDYRELTKKFAEIGNSPDVVAHYARTDGRGGFVVIKPTPGNEAKDLETTLRYIPWVEFENTPVTTMEEAFPIIQSVYG